VRLLGLDLGGRRIGVAVSDPNQVLARSIEVIQRRSKEEDFEAIARLAREYEVEAIVVGYPRRLNGTAGKEARKVEAYVAQMEERLKIPIILWDERLTTVRAARARAEAGKKRPRLGLDAAAAAAILQGYLDYLRRDEQKSL